MNRYSINRVDPARVEDVYCLLVACGAEMAARGFMNWSSPYPLDRLRADAAEREVYLVTSGDEGSTPVATFTVGTSPSRPYDAEIWEEPGVEALYLNRLAVSPSAQGEGLGSRCMREIETMASSRGCRAVRFDVLAENAGLRGFYERLGYRARGEREHGGWRFACYERRLGEGWPRGDGRGGRSRTARYRRLLRHHTGIITHGAPAPAARHDIHLFVHTSIHVYLTFRCIFVVQFKPNGERFNAMGKAGSKHHPAMEIRISGLNDGEYPFSFDVPASDIGLDEAFVGNVRAAGTLRKVSTQFFLTGTVGASYAGECDRCLGEIRRDLAIPLKLFYGPDLGEGTASGEENDEETRTIGVEQESIVLDEEVRQTIMLEMPLKMLCSEGCRGICSGCGADLNRERCTCEGEEIDPRWAKLADVFKKKDE